MHQSWNRTNQDTTDTTKVKVWSVCRKSWLRLETSKECSFWPMRQPQRKSHLDYWILLIDIVSSRINRSGFFSRSKVKLMRLKKSIQKSNNIVENSATLRIEPSGNNPAFKVRLLVKYQTGLRETGACWWFWRRMFELVWRMKTLLGWRFKISNLEKFDAFEESANWKIEERWYLSLKEGLIGKLD